MRAAASSLKPVLLELGGKNALIAYDDVDPAIAASAIVRGMNFSCSGQSCGSTSRAFVHRDIYDEVLRLLSSRGYGVPAELLARDFSQPYVPDPGVREVWRQVYRDVETHWDLYELAEKLVDLEYRFHLWRFSHMKTVERIIGAQAGTGGTSGVTYLKKALELRFYPELWDVRGEL